MIYVGKIARNISLGDNLIFVKLTWPRRVNLVQVTELVAVGGKIIVSGVNLDNVKVKNTFFPDAKVTVLSGPDDRIDQ